MIYGRKSIIHGITFCFSIVLILFLTSCEKGLSIKEAVEEFSLEDAKVFHLEHAADLRLPNGGNNVKSTIDYEEILVPQWNNATYHEVQFPSKLAKTYEIPLNTGTIVGGVLLKEKGDSYERATMKSSLVIQEFSQGEKKTLRQMVVTIIGNDSEGNANSETFSYMGSHKSLTGFMVVSTLEGKIVNIFQYLNGARSMVYVKRTEEAAINTPLCGFSFLKSHGTKSAYGNSEPGICSVCNKPGLVYVEYGMCESCVYAWEEELGEIIVTPNPEYCDKCGRLQDECECNPFACPVCGFEPCQCNGPEPGCEYCGELGCNGECRGDGDGGGDGVGNNSSNNNSTQLTVSISYNGDTRCERIVKPLIVNLSKSPMARNLMNSFKNIIFRMGPYNKPALYDPETGEIKISSLYVNYDFTILEELVHRLQHENGSLFYVDEMNNNYLNLEIEAKILIFLYGERYPSQNIAHLIGGDKEVWLDKINEYLNEKSVENYQSLQDYFVKSCEGYDEKFKSHKDYRNTNNINEYILQLKNE